MNPYWPNDEKFLKNRRKLNAEDKRHEKEVVFQILSVALFFHVFRIFRHFRGPIALLNLKLH